ncbi:dol-P-Man:Man(7)GlcNAc(2)-PP-Dol alpha-1,6-mannosyltransferase [Helicoverpa zea]|uniref:dol-P-Man:Man(7)GlcNAc(2)-PP-Dol alpha-1,6-mannosyltransferase n=1 Tax=Helicoverpa zea TaxID=7113 RepID=UPI001F5AC425|nr:dol-P-Man:Man(7)GlcNAc(2)-PP-Dol alpha-1,6-mannosyltransferase [Helicoverpa zea]
MVQLLYIIASLHVLLCPFTKVEESFNIQATHDILYHRLNLSQYDHNEFPGVVPRTFIGPLVISAFSAPVVSFFHLTGINKFWMQYVVRLVLALTVIGAWARLRNALLKQFGSTYAWWYTLITVTQYHFMFYMSRPLPNIMVLPLVLLAFEGWLSGKHKQFIISAGASIIIFRAELAMLFGLFLIIDLYFKKIDITTLFKIAVPAGVGLVALTVAVDSIFWRRLLWPEAEVFWYNTILNKSSDWGTSPFLWYFYSALPRGLGPSLILIPVGMYIDRRMIQFAAPAFVYILLYSFLPHKELRFIIYVFPLLNMASAAACSYVYVRRTKAPIFELLFWGSVFVILGNIIISLAFVLVAMTNYPGGVAITRFHKILRNEPFVHVHICNLAAQTGVTRYTQINDRWMYSKNESLPVELLQDYTHLLIEAKSKYSSNLKSFASTHSILDSVESFSQVAMNYKLMPPVKIKTKPALFILERKDFREFPLGHSVESLDSIRRKVDEKIMSDETVVDFINYDSIEELASKEASSDASKEELPVKVKELSENDSIVDSKESLLEDELKPAENDIVEEIKEPLVQEPIVQEEQETLEDSSTKLPKAKKAFDDLKALRQERKRKAIEKIKTETRKEVVASAKEKLKEIMKRHKHIADELSETIISDINVELDQKDGRGDIPEAEMFPELPKEDIEEAAEIERGDADDKNVEEIIEKADVPNKTNENIDAIVEEVIHRLIDRKIYDDKTKPEDMKPEDRLMIQKIVEEVISERLNYSNNDNNK